MTSGPHSEIVIQGAKTNNLKNISLRIPHNRLIAVTGVSGSGKSSLVFEIIAKEGQRRYFETLPSFSRQFIGKLNRPDVDSIEGLSPVIAIGQHTSGNHPRSTVGTMTDIYDLLRLLYARTGKTVKHIELSRALFSFNSEIGKCVRCNGIGNEEQIDLNRLISNPKKSIREGALAPTLPTGYIMYSQVTIDVLNQVCQAEGFNVDIPWQELTDAQSKIILYGSEKIKVPFGKHSLESRLKWTGIKAKPREKGYYKGMIPIMSDILKRDRNTNILKYVHAVNCPNCHGTRLNEDALSVTIHGKSIADATTLEINQLKLWIAANSWNKVAAKITTKISEQIEILTDLGLGHLTIDRPSTSLRPSEIQRLRVANQILVPLSDVLYVFDEPSIGLHREETDRLIYYFKQLVKKGNTVIVVEHDLQTISSADHIIEIGPKAGVDGGRIIYNGPFTEFSTNQSLHNISPTYRAIHSVYKLPQTKSQSKTESIQLIGCQERNLKKIDVAFQLGKLNVVSGRSGVGKSSLVKGTLLKIVKEQLNKIVKTKSNLSDHQNLDRIQQLILIDNSPIGKTPRSNPATYLGISDHIRDLFANLPKSKEKGFTKSRFSFNNKGGRCETCQGAGKTQIGMHFLGKIDLVCGNCNGDRFNNETLDIKYNDHTIADIYRLSITEALLFFQNQKKVLSGLTILEEIGLGYLTLGQSSTALSGGEAQRIKIANQLQKKDTGDTLYIIIEPSIGLHYDDIQTLIGLFDRIKQKGNTIVCIEQNPVIIANSDWHIELGPNSGSSGGTIAYQGSPVVDQGPKGSIKSELKPLDSAPKKEIRLTGVTTHGLKNIDVRIPKNQLTVVTGLSGSGKSSLVFDTIFAESNARFTESLSTYNRSFLQQNSEAQIASFSGLGPAIGITRKVRRSSKRSTVGTLSGVYDSLRLLYSRIAQHGGEKYTAQHFSHNHHLGACVTCKGLGELPRCNPDEVVIDPTKSIFEGAISTNKAMAYYADPNGQFVAILLKVAKVKKWNIDRPWQELSPVIQEVILYGTGETMWNVEWNFNTKSRTGIQSLTKKWFGFCNYIDEEYQRKRQNKNIKLLESLLHRVTCPTCVGSRLKSYLLTTKFRKKNIHELCQLSIAECYELLQPPTDVYPSSDIETDKTMSAISEAVLPAVTTVLKTIVDLGLGYLSLDRTVSTLSGGELQRVVLAGQLSTHLYGVTYVLDEPTIALDSSQVEVLIKVLRQIVDNGNTVIVVEHDASLIRESDYVIEMGPGAGSLGGTVVYQGKIEDVALAKHSFTYKLMNTQKTAPIKQSAITSDLPRSSFGIHGASANNLKDIDVNLYANQIIAIEGVSGSGKSSLIRDVLYASWIKRRPTNCIATFGMDQFDEVLFISQEALTQNRLSTPLSSTGILEEVKSIFSKTDSAQKLGFKKADFSYQSKNGKCPLCAGYGKRKTSMDFMSDLWLTCESCKGLRYNDHILTCVYKERSIGEVLQMTVLEAKDFFDLESIVVPLEILIRLGVGHLHLGQSSATLSGGETQRLKLATTMMQKQQGTKLYLFDEPSTGLHYFDILPLIDVFQSLVDNGDTVLYIEHNSTLIAAANQVITLGPGSGEHGGKIISD